MEIENVPKVYVIECFDITLKSGQTASFSLREDLGDSEFVDENNSWWFLFPREKRECYIRWDDVAAFNHVSIEQKKVEIIGRDAKRKVVIGNVQGQDSTSV